MANIEPLRPFQAEDVPYFLTHPRSMILYEPRLGKTVVSCNVLALDPKTSDILIICSKNAMSVWLDHIKSWFTALQPDWRIDFRIVRSKNNSGKAVREEMWARPRKPGFITVYLVTFNALLFDQEFITSRRITFDSIIADEIHTKLRNRKTKSSIFIKALARKARRVHLLSGTLAGKWGPADYFSPLSILNPIEFASYWKFANTFCVFVETYFGREIIGTKNMDAFHRILQRFAKIRDRATYGPQMPKVTRDLLRVDMTSEQSKLYDTIGRENFAFTEHGTIILAENALVRMLRKRQILVCPKILDPKLGVGGAFEDILERLAQAKEDEDAEGQHIVIFSAVRAALPFYVAELRAAGYSNVFVLAGGTEPEDLVKITSAFEKTKGILLCTTQFAQAFSLASSHICYHIGWDYDPNNNKQAEDRLVAQSGDYSINSWYYAYNDTDDDWLAEQITIKSRIIHFTQTNPKDLPKPELFSGT